MKIIIDEEKCLLCGSCVDVCPPEYGVLKLGEKCVEVVNIDNCTGCMSCVVACEYDALKCIEE